ncbi:hypothetical protein [Acuticoccus mangrovi]|uniref:Sulfotransferase family protein n=1 Tax=Acuticoccus mangrovi TaxID=2796142 RepID=A0A934ILK4_9HYPH|nr:hypothetical protein [Acuticoccus mangrovi]MBJ3774502.1 hypothetical protein [Acuticoccus mangrovi]
MRLILHIGSTKTGSSALQSTLFHRRNELADVGVHYSTLGVQAGAHHLLAAAIHPGAWKMHVKDLPEDRAAYFDDTAAVIMHDAELSGADTVVISSEYFWGSLPVQVYKTFREAFEPAQFEIIAYVRRQDEWAMSSYLQAVKTGESLPFAEWFEKKLMRATSGLHYFRIISRWAYFLDAKVHVLRYQDVKTNVYKGFADALDIPVDTNIELDRVNPSPSPEGLELLLAVNRSDLSAEQKLERRREIMSTHRASGPVTLLMDGPERDLIMKVARPSDRLIAREYLHSDSPLFAPPDAQLQPVSDPA